MKKMKAMIIGIVTLLVLVIAAGCGGSKAADKPPADPAKTIEDAAKKKLNDRFEKMTIVDYANDPTKKIVSVYFKGGDNLSTNMIRGGIQVDASYIFEEIAKSGIQVYEAYCFTDLPLVDKYGNKSDQAVVKIGFKGETLQKINWSGVSKTELGSIADTYWVHPALK